MAASILKRVCAAVRQAALQGLEELTVYGIKLHIEYVAGHEYRAILEDGGEICRFEMRGGAVENLTAA